MNFLKYEEARPREMRAMLARAPVAYVPFGALEWHGEHGPLGLDGLKARALCEAAAERTGGVVFPAVYWGAFDTMPFEFTLHFKKYGTRVMVRETLRQLDQWGFKIVVLLTGHYPPSQIKMLRKECRRFNKKGGALALGAPEQVFALDLHYYGDHAGKWETSIMLALRPELIDLAAMPPGLPAIERLRTYGVMGQDPAAKADADLGQSAIDHVAQGLAAAVTRALEEKSGAAFEEAYERYDRAVGVSARGLLSGRVWALAKEALDVHSLGELIRYGIWSLKNQ